MGPSTGAIVNHRSAASSFRRILPTPGARRIEVVPSEELTTLDPMLSGFWKATSLLALFLVGVGVLRLRRLESGAEIINVDGLDVLMTSNAGPLSFGIFRPRIIMPRWFLELGAIERELVVAHEREHLERADPTLVVFAALMAVFMPWNPVVWYMLRRLRIAIELDCDRRVLRRHPDRRTYAELLLYIAGRRTSHSYTAAGFAVSRSSLERRLLLMRDKSSRFKARHVAMLLVGSGLFAAATAMIPLPSLRSKASTATLQPGRTVATRATGRIKITAASGYAAFSIYSVGGAFAAPGVALHARTDTVSETVGSESRTAAFAVYDVDVTDGDVYIVSNGGTVHIEAAMTGSSPAAWASATGSEIRIDRGGIGITPIRKAARNPGAASLPNP
jgi:uncharacterized membrane protein YidH (DUF202 family)